MFGFFPFHLVGHEPGRRRLPSIPSEMLDERLSKANEITTSAIILPKLSETSQPHNGSESVMDGRFECVDGGAEIARDEILLSLLVRVLLLSREINKATRWNEAQLNIHENGVSQCSQFRSNNSEELIKRN